MPNSLTAWLNDISVDARKMQNIGVAANLMAQFQAIAGEADGKGWLVSNPVGTAHLAATAGLGVVESYWTNGARINRPSSVQLLSNGDFIVGNINGIAQYDSNWNFIKNIISSTLSGQVTDMALDEANNRVYTCNSAEQLLHAFDLTTGALVWTFGTKYAPGNPQAGLLYTPRGIDTLSSGNILVSCQNSQGVNTANRGIICEISAAGVYVATRIESPSGNQPWNMSVLRPGKIRLDGLKQRLYVIQMYNDTIPVFDVANWSYATLYDRPSNLPVGGLHPSALHVSADHNELIVYGDGPKMIAAIDITTHQLKWFSGSAYWDDNVNAINRTGDLWSVQDIIEASPGKYLCSDYGNNRLTVVSNIQTFNIQYDLQVPVGWRVVQSALPQGYAHTADNAIADTYTVLLGDAAKAAPLYIPIEKIPAQ